MLSLCWKVVELLQYYRISLGQIASNNWLIWSCFMLLCYRKRVENHLEIFRQYYKLISTWMRDGCLEEVTRTSGTTFRP